jgi:PAS domain S-box-containing protein
VTATSAQGDLLRELLDDARDGILALDENGSVVYLNERAASILGKERRDALGTPFAVFVPLDERRAFRHALAALESDPASFLRVHLDGAAGTLIAVIRRLASAEPASHSVVITSESGAEPAKPAGAVRPIPNTRPLTRELDTFFLRFPYGVIGIDRTLRVAFANPRARSILGAERLRLGQPLDDGAAEGRLRAIAERLASVAANVPSTTIALADGRRLRVNGIPARRADPAVVLFEDVTKETQHDQITRDFVRNAAHQLRTPLTGIASAVQVLQSGAKEVPADRDRFLEHVQRHTGRLSRLARGLLVLARADAGEPLRLEFVELRPLLEGVIAEAAAPRPGVRLELDCPPGIAALCEPDLAREAVAALVENAVQHTAEGVIEVVVREDDRRVTLDVSDSGEGILPEHRERLFEPFYRAVESGAGFGLGLAIAARAVEAMHGEISVSDAADRRGARFTIRLPSARLVP